MTMVEFRRLLVNVVRQEMLLDILPARKVKMIRNQLRVPKYDPDDEFNIYGKDKFSPPIYRRFIEVVKESYSSLRPEDRGFEALLSSLSKEVRDDLGFVCSNYGYALRAMALNDSFMVELASIIYAYSNLDALEAETSAL